MNVSLTLADPERTVEFEFVRATENAALNVLPWLGRGEKEKADAAACDAINGVFDLVDISGEVVIGEGAKDNAPGLFLGDKLGTWRPGSPRFDIAVDPIDGTTNLANGLPNSISVMAASERGPGGSQTMRSIPSFYSMKLASVRRSSRRSTQGWILLPLTIPWKPSCAASRRRWASAWVNWSW